MVFWINKFINKILKNDCNVEVMIWDVKGLIFIVYLDIVEKIFFLLWKNIENVKNLLFIDDFKKVEMIVIFYMIS